MTHHLQMHMSTSAVLHQQLPNQTVHTIPASTAGTRSEGLLLAVRRQLPFSITRWDTDQDIGVIRLTLRPSHTRQRTTTIGVCYIPPDSSISAQQGDGSAQVRFQALTQRLTSASL